MKILEKKIKSEKNKVCFAVPSKITKNYHLHKLDSDEWLIARNYCWSTTLKALLIEYKKLQWVSGI